MGWKNYWLTSERSKNEAKKTVARTILSHVANVISDSYLCDKCTKENLSCDGRCIDDGTYAFSCENFILVYQKLEWSKEKKSGIYDLKEVSLEKVIILDKGFRSVAKLKLKSIFFSTTAPKGLCTSRLCSLKQRWLDLILRDGEWYDILFIGENSELTKKAEKLTKEEKDFVKKHIKPL